MTGLTPPSTGSETLNEYLRQLQGVVDVLDLRKIPEEGWSLTDLKADVSEVISDKREVIDVANEATSKLAEVKALIMDLDGYDQSLEEARAFKVAAEGLLDWYDQNEVAVQALQEMVNREGGASELVEAFDAIRVEIERSSTAARASETAAAISKTAAANSASAADSSATAAATSATNAKTSETNAKASETAANTSKNAAATSATNAKTSETNAKASETAVSNSATASANSAAAAKTSEDNAKTSETNAKASETAAASSKTAAASSASAANTSKNAAATSATNAANSATAAANSATQAGNIASSTSWSGDKLTVNGKTSPSLTGPPGTLEDGSVTTAKLDPASVTSTLASGAVENGLKIVATSSGGGILVGDPGYALDAANKRYVDNQISTHKHLSADITDKVSGVSSTSTTDNKLVATSGGGYLQTSKPPVAAADVTNKSYVDNQISTHKHVPADVGASFAATASTIPVRDSGGRLAAMAPVAPGQVATKLYVDQRPALFSGAGDPPSTIAGAVVGDFWLNTTTMELHKITGV